jgi:hypothetical protein
MGTKLYWYVVVGCFTTPFYRVGIFKLIQRASFFSAFVSTGYCQATEPLQRCHDGGISLVLASEPSSSSSSSSSSFSSVYGAGGNRSYRTSAFEAVCTLTPVLVPPFISSSAPRQTA